MKKEIQLHPSQAEILRVLLFNPKPRFRDLNCQCLSTDHFSFHIKSLMEAGLIVKTQNRYGLTVIGKEFANRLDMERQTPQIEKQAKVSVLIFATQKQGGVGKYLLQQRLKQPYFGYFGGVGGKLKIGETLFEGAERELNEETGLAAKLSLAGVSHKMDYSQEKVLLEDKEMVAKLFLLQFYLFGCVIVRLRKMLFAVAGLRPQNILLVFLASLENLKFRYEIVLQPFHLVSPSIIEQ